MSSDEVVADLAISPARTVGLDQTIVSETSSDKIVTTDSSQDKTTDLVSESSSAKTIMSDVSLIKSEASDITAISVGCLDKPAILERECSPQQLCKIEENTSNTMPSCNSNVQTYSVPETPPNMKVEETEDKWELPEFIPLGNILPDSNDELHISAENMDSSVEGTTVEETPESQQPSIPSPSQAESAETSMEVECSQPVTDATGRLTFDFSSNKGFCVTGAWTDFKHYRDNFLRGCKWAPDGSCILVNSNDGYLRLFNLPDIFFPNSEQDWNSVPEMRSVLKILDGDLVYDYCWYPRMTSLDAATSCFASTSRHSPIHLFDAFTGQLRCSYRPYNQMDELEPAHCLCFSPDGQKLYSGFDKTIRIFDVNVPGREYETRKTKASQQTGIISCIAVNPDRSGIYAAGSYLKTIGLYRESDGVSVGFLEGQQGGVTHMMFSLDGTKLFTGGRKDSEIRCWDIRNTGELLYVMQREVTTNQRIYFDIESTGQYLASGSMNGDVYVWDTSDPESDDAIQGEQVLHPKMSFIAQEDCTNGVSFHPTLPVVATASGQRKFAEPIHSEDSDEDDSIFTDRYIVRDNSLKLWWCGS